MFMDVVMITDSTSDNFVCTWQTIHAIPPLQAHARSYFFFNKTFFMILSNIQSKNSEISGSNNGELPDKE